MSIPSEALNLALPPVPRLQTVGQLVRSSVARQADLLSEALRASGVDD